MIITELFLSTAITKSDKHGVFWDFIKRTN